MLADIVLVVHFAFAAFVVGSLPLIWAGAWMKWGFVRNRSFRLAHLGAIFVVAAESLAGVVCPLTLLEDALRQTERNAGSFIRRWLHRILFHDVPEGMLTMLYVIFAGLVMATFLLFPPCVRPSRPPPPAS